MNYPKTDHFAEAALAAGPGAAPADAVQVTVPRPWRQPADEQVLDVRFRCSGSPEAPVLAVELAGERICLDDPVGLEPVVIPKPWGREIWHTGIEARGESSVVIGETRLGLGSYLALAPERLCQRQPIVLLKILDPRPEPVLGELYLEVHEEKQEVYVVTDLDRAAWPEGRGRIRYGVNQQLRCRYDDDAAFRAAFLEAVQAYEAVRRAVDDGAAGLEAAEAAARSATLAFTSERSLAVGDVISVPAWVPHSLQHGVQVVEFQTPTYERFIISSSQRVLTQDGWDSAHAIARMRLDTPPDPEPEPLAPGIERVVRFDDFGVWRARLDAGMGIALPVGVPYVIALCMSGSIHLPGRERGLDLGAGESALIPATAAAMPLRAARECQLLLAAPGL